MVSNRGMISVTLKMASLRLVRLSPQHLKNREWILGDTGGRALRIDESRCPWELRRLIFLKVQMKCFFLFPNLKEQQKSGRSPSTVS